MNFGGLNSYSLGGHPAKGLTVEADAAVIIASVVTANASTIASSSAHIIVEAGVNSIGQRVTNSSGDISIHSDVQAHGARIASAEGAIEIDSSVLANAVRVANTNASVIGTSSLYIGFVLVNDHLPTSARRRVNVHAENRGFHVTEPRVIRVAKESRAIHINLKRAV